MFTADVRVQVPPRPPKTKETSVRMSLLFLSGRVRDLNPSKCRCPVDICLMPAGRHQHLNLRRRGKCNQVPPRLENRARDTWVVRGKESMIAKDLQGHRKEHSVIPCMKKDHPLGWSFLVNQWNRPLLRFPSAPVPDPGTGFCRWLLFRIRLHPWDTD